MIYYKVKIPSGDLWEQLSPGGRAAIIQRVSQNDDKEE